jgi:hypothetical protein
LRTLALRLGLAALGMCLASTAVLLAYIYSEPLGLRGSGVAPRWASDTLRQDSIAFPIHTALGSVFNWSGAPVAVSETQWVKAAAHARSKSDSEQVAGGLIAVWRRHPVPQYFADRVCWQLRGVKRPATVAAEEIAGIHCDIMAGRAKPQ